MDLDQSTTTSIISFFMKATAAVSMVFLSKLYKIVSCIEEDKNQKYYVTYYKISELENYIEALQHDVTHIKETCVRLEDKLAMQTVLLQRAYHAVPQEDLTTTNELEPIHELITNEFEVISEACNDATSGTTSEQTLNAMEKNDDEVVRPLTSIKEETILPDYVEEKNKMNAEQDFEHVVNASSVDAAPKYKLWKGVY